MKLKIVLEIAHTVRELRPSTPSMYRLWEQMADDLGKMCARYHHEFDVEKWDKLVGRNRDPSRL